MISKLEDFYDEINAHALQTFLNKLHRWVKNPPDAYIGFVGELCVADQLREYGAHHHFIPETQSASTPDIELTIIGTRAYIEIKTLQENIYTRFTKRIQQEIEILDLPIGRFSIRKVSPANGKEEALVVIAVQRIREAIFYEADSPIDYEGEEGMFSLIIRPITTLGAKHTGWVMSWPGSRLRRDSTPWAQSMLEEALRDNIQQFKIHKPTFLAWVSFDYLLPDLSDHASQVLKKFGETEFSHVAGIIILDSFTKWDLVENPYREYQTDIYVDLFDAIRRLKQ